MGKKQVIVLGALAGVLLVILLGKKLAERTPDLEREYGLERLAPEEFLVSDVARAELYRGSKKDAKVSLIRGADGWTVETAFKAPGDKKKIEEFLGKVKDLEGEYRSEGAGILGDFELDDEKALHVVTYREGAEEPWSHVLVGRKEAYGRSFARRSGEEPVYTVNVNLASEMGIWGDDSDKAPESSHWVDKTVVDLDKDRIDRVAIVTPDRSLAIERREKAPAKEAGAEEGAAEDEKDKKKEYEWVVAEGGPGLEIKQSGVDGVLGALDKFEASDVVDPAGKEGYGLGTPGFRCTARVEGGKETVILAAQKKPGEDAYVTVKGGETVFKVSDWKLDDLFAKAKDLFDLKGVAEDKDAIVRVGIAYPSATVECAKGADGTWKAESPRTGLEFKDSKVKDVAGKLAALKPVDYADAKDAAEFGLSTPEYTITFAKEGGPERKVRVGAEARTAKGRYVLVDDDPRVYVIEKWDFEQIAPKPKDLFGLDVADVAADDVEAVEIERAGSRTVLEREGEGWKLRVGDASVEPDKSKVDAYVGRFSPLEASDLHFDAKPGDLAAERTVTLRAKGDRTVAIALAAEKDGEHRATVAGKEVVVSFTSFKAKDIAPELGGLVDLDVADVKAEDVTGISVARAADAFELARKDGGWELVMAGERKPCDAEAVRGYLGRFSPLAADGAAVGTAGGTRATITVKRKDAEAVTLVLGATADGRTRVGREGAGVVYLVDEGRAAALAPGSEKLLPKAEPAPAPGNDTEAAGGEAKE